MSFNISGGRQIANILNKQTVLGHNVTMTNNCHFSCVNIQRNETNVGALTPREQKEKTGLSLTHITTGVILV